MPAPVNRTLISRGPAFIKFGTGPTAPIFYSKEDITLDWALSNAVVTSSAFGDIYSYRNGIVPTLAVPLVGEIEHLNVLFPFGEMIPGKSIFGATDTPLAIIPLDPTQDVTVFHSAAIASEPELTLGVSGGVALGSTSFRFLPRLGAELTDPDAWYLTRPHDPLTDAATGFDPALIRIQSYDIHWLSGGKIEFDVGPDTTAELAYNTTAAALQTALNALADITAVGGVTVTGDHRYGWRVTFGDPGVAMPAITGAVVSGMPGGSRVDVEVIVPGSATTQQVLLIKISPWGWLPNENAVQIRTSPTLTDQTADSVSVYDVVFSGTSATATFVPLNVTPEDLAAAARVQGPEAALGANVSSAAHDLVVSATGLKVTLHGALITKAGAAWSATKQRVPDIEWTASRTVSGSTVSPLYTVTDNS